MIRFEHVGKDYAGWTAIEDLSLTVEKGEFCVLIGPSGSGKTTTLKMINRLIEHDRGRILFEGAEIRSFAPEELRRRMGYAIQSIGLFPHWTVEENIGAVPKLLGWPRAKIRDRVTELLEMLTLDPERYRARYPRHLSGGEQQRIGVARALAANPSVLLMDEPFGALDPVTRDTLQAEMLRIQAASGTTVVLVTHDIDEAIRLASRIVILEGAASLNPAARARSWRRRPMISSPISSAGRIAASASSPPSASAIACAAARRRWASRSPSMRACARRCRCSSPAMSTACRCRTAPAR